MKKSSFKYRNEYFAIVGSLIYAYLIHRSLSRVVILMLMGGGITLLTIDPVVAYILGQVSEIGEALTHTQLGIGFTLIAIALVIYALKTLFEHRQGLPPKVEPIRSILEPYRNSRDHKDAKDIKGRDFNISASFLLIGQRKPAQILKIDMLAIEQGLYCFATTQAFFVDGRQVVSLSAGFEPTPTNMHTTYRVDNYERFQPPVEVKANSSVEFRVKRDFGPPIQGQGVPFDFSGAELAVTIEYVVDGRVGTETHCFKPIDSTGKLKVIDEISDIPFLNDRQITFWYRERAISTEERDTLLNVKPEVRKRVLDCERDDEEAALHYGISEDSVKLIRNLSHWKNLPHFDPKSIQLTPFGKVTSWIIKFLSKGRDVNLRR